MKVAFTKDKKKDKKKPISYNCNLRGCLINMVMMILIFVFYFSFCFWVVIRLYVSVFYI